MRIIDADSIRQKAVPHTRGERAYCADIKKWAVLVSDIDEAPTIEAESVKHGRWIVANDGTHFCSECGCDASYTWDDIDRFFINSADDVPDHISNYCPNCGAKMDLEET